MTGDIAAQKKRWAAGDFLQDIFRMCLSDFNDAHGAVGKSERNIIPMNFSNRNDFALVVTLLEDAGLTEGKDFKTSNPQNAKAYIELSVDDQTPLRLSRIASLVMERIRTDAENKVASAKGRLVASLDEYAREADLGDKQAEQFAQRIKGAAVWGTEPQRPRSGGR
jgi:hypothetical protein